jgi:hypothetical protein
VQEAMTRHPPDFDKLLVLSRTGRAFIQPLLASRQPT